MRSSQKTLRLRRSQSLRGNQKLSHSLRQSLSPNPCLRLNRSLNLRLSQRLSRSLMLNLSQWLSQRLNSLLLHNSKSLSPSPSHWLSLSPSLLLKSLPQHNSQSVLLPHSRKNPQLRSS